MCRATSSICSHSSSTVTPETRSCPLHPNFTNTSPLVKFKLHQTIATTVCDSLSKVSDPALQRAAVIEGWGNIGGNGRKRRGRDRGRREGGGFPSPPDSLTKSPTTHAFWISLYSSHQVNKDLAWLWLGGLIFAASCSPANISYHLRATRVREVPGSLLPSNFCLLPKAAPRGLSQHVTFS